LIKQNLTSLENNLVETGKEGSIYQFKSPIDGRKLKVVVSEGNTNVIAITRDKRSPLLSEISWILEKFFVENESFTLLSYRKD